MPIARAGVRGIPVRGAHSLAIRQEMHRVGRGEMKSNFWFILSMNRKGENARNIGGLECASHPPRRPFRDRTPPIRSYAVLPLNIRLQPIIKVLEAVYASTAAAARDCNKQPRTKSRSSESVELL